MQLQKIILSIFIFCALQSHAQITNILDSMHINDISIINWTEKGDYYYCIRLKSAGAMGIWKYNKYTLQPYDSLTILTGSGDVVSNNYVLFDFNSEGNINMLYGKKSLSTGNIDGLYFMQTDTNLNITVNEKWLPIYSGIQSYTPTYTGGILCATVETTPPAGAAYSMLYNIDKYGDLVRTDTAGITPLQANQYVTKVLPYNSVNNQYLIAGVHLTHIQSAPNFDFYIADSALNIIDTFKAKYSNNFPEFYMIPPDITTLPNGTVVFATTGSIPQTSYLTLFTKANSSNRFTIADSQIYSNATKADSADFCHKRESRDCIKYNPYDRHLYFVTATNTNSVWGGNCINPSNGWPISHAFAEITCVDTNMQLQWVKHIRFNFKYGYCPSIGLKLAVPDGRNGIIFTGSGLSQTDDTLPQVFQEFVFYVNENTITDSPINLSIINNKTNGYRQISVYPNPTTNTITISNLYDKPFVSVMILDLNGRKLIQNELSNYQPKIKIEVSSLANGMYIIKALSKDGLNYYSKFVKD